jgi:hypothetical protein
VVTVRSRTRAPIGGNAGARGQLGGLAVVAGSAAPSCRARGVEQTQRHDGR